jgi:hypothetical protein
MGAWEFAYNLDGSNQPPSVMGLPIITGQTLKAGTPMILSSGQITPASAGTAGRVVGVLAEDITTPVAGTLVDCYITTPSQVWRATASGDATSHVLAAHTYDLTTSSVINVSDTTGGCVTIVALQPGSTTAVYASFTTTLF